MTESYSIDGTPTLLVRDDTPELVESADHGNVGSGSLTIDDVTGTYAIVGHKEVIVEQDECSFARTFTGYVGRRPYKRTAPPTGTSRQIDVSLLDLNARLGFYVIRGRSWNRPAETIAARLTALLGSAFLSPLVADNGFVDYPTHQLDRNDYRGQYPLDVIRDCALEVGFNYFVYPHDPTFEPSLWFRDSNASTAFSSTLRISNVLSDIDDSTTFESSKTAQLDRDPSQVYSGAFLAFAKGSVFRARAATSLAFEPRHGVAPNSQVKRRSRAIALADRFLFERRNEEDIITDEILLPKTHVNLMRAGQRIQARYSDFTPEGYGEFTWFRILETRKKPTAKETLYKVGLTLSPQEGGCSVQPTHVQDHYMEGVESTTYFRTYHLDAASTPGNLLVLAVQSSNGALDVASAPSGWTWVVQNELNDTGDATGWRGNVFYKKSEGETSVTVQFAATGASSQPRGVLIEYAGLTNPTLNSITAMHRDHNLGYALAPTISYPAGAALVLAFGFFPLGPGSGNHLTEFGSGELVYGLVPDPPGTGSIDCHAALGGGDGAPIGANCYGAGVGKLGAIHDLRSPSDTAGSTADGGGWSFLETDNGWTMTVGLVFTGDNC